MLDSPLPRNHPFYSPPDRQRTAHRIVATAASTNFLQAFDAVSCPARHLTQRGSQLGGMADRTGGAR
jgi:hypothetical protein